MIEEKNQFLGQNITNDFKENFKKFKEKVKNTKPDEYKQMVENSV